MAAMCGSTLRAARIKLPRMRKAFAEFPTKSDEIVIDTETTGLDASNGVLDRGLWLIDPRGRTFLPAHAADAHALARGRVACVPGLRSAAPGRGLMLRSLSLSERKRDLVRLCRQSHTHFLKHSSFPDGGPCSTIATNSDLRVSFPSAGRRATRAARADGAPAGAREVALRSRAAEDNRAAPGHSARAA